MKVRFTVPVLFLIFNRPETTQKVFEVIKNQKPSYLFIAADGPRMDKEGEAEKCRITRELVLQGIDWDCEVKTYFRNSNVGCGRNVSDAITWFFEHVPEGIILEDDCLPNASFFSFCAELLEKYRDNNAISAISGNNFQLQQPMLIEADYYYSLFPSSWGWATWRRSWQDYELYINKWEKIDKVSFLQYLFEENEYQLWWKNQYDYFFKERPIDTWDFQFHFQSMLRRQLAVIPKANLISNIGHGPDGTHFNNPDSYFANMPTYELDFPLKHPERIERNYEADVFIQDMLFGRAEVVSNFKKMKRLIKRLIKYTPQ